MIKIGWGTENWEVCLCVCVCVGELGQRKSEIFIFNRGNQ